MEDDAPALDGRRAARPGTEADSPLTKAFLEPDLATLRLRADAEKAELDVLEARAVEGVAEWWSHHYQAHGWAQVGHFDQWAGRDTKLAIGRLLAGPPGCWPATPRRPTSCTGGRPSTAPPG